MPIIINDFKWTQSFQTITINVPMKNNNTSSKVDIFISEGFIKASFENKFFEAFPLHSIICEKSNCTITSLNIVFELVKKEPIFWEKLEKNLTKKEKLKLKQQYIEEKMKKSKEKCVEVEKKKSDLKREAIREQISLDSEQREKIENFKLKEKQNALKLFEKNQCIINLNTQAKDENDKISTKVKYKENKLNIVPIRSIRSLEVSLFTKREFPTPMRESKIKEEIEWLKKQTEARRSVGFISEELRPEERNPQFLLDKGNEFMKNKNYLGAISAYSFGITLNNKFADLYVARSNAHLNIGNYSKTVLDCSKAMDLLKPAVKLNLIERSLCIGRRGIALIKLNHIQEGIGELEASLNLSPNYEFSQYLNEARKILLKQQNNKEL